MMTVILPDLPLALAQPYTSLTHHTYFYMYQPLTSTHPLTHLHAPPTFFHAPLICTQVPLTHCHSPLTHFHAPLTHYHALSRTHARHTAFYLCPLLIPMPKLIRCKSRIPLNYRRESRVVGTVATKLFLQNTEKKVSIHVVLINSFSLSLTILLAHYNNFHASEENKIVHICDNCGKYKTCYISAMPRHRRSCLGRYPIPRSTLP